MPQPDDATNLSDDQMGNLLLRNVSAFVGIPDANFGGYPISRDTVRSLSPPSGFRFRLQRNFRDTNLAQRRQCLTAGPRPVGISDISLPIGVALPPLQDLGRKVK